MLRGYIFLLNIQSDQKCDSMCLSTCADYLLKRCCSFEFWILWAVGGRDGGRCGWHFPCFPKGATILNLPLTHLLPSKNGRMAWGREKELHSFARFNSHFRIQAIMQNKGLPGARQIVFIWRPRPNLAGATSSWWCLVAFSRLGLSPLPFPNPTPLPLLRGHTLGEATLFLLQLSLWRSVNTALSLLALLFRMPRGLLRGPLGLSSWVSVP